MESMTEMTDAPPEAGNLEFLVLADLDRLALVAGGQFFPDDRPGESFRDAVGRRWEELRAALIRLAARLDEARTEGRL